MVKKLRAQYLVKQGKYLQPVEEDSPLSAIIEMPLNRGCRAEIVAFLLGGVCLVAGMQSAAKQGSDQISSSTLFSGLTIPPEEHKSHGSQKLITQGKLN